MQRKCGCGKHTASSGACGACQAEQSHQLQRRPNAHGTATEPFNVDQSDVKAHTTEADRSSQRSNTPMRSETPTTFVEHHRKQLTAKIRRVDQRDSTLPESARPTGQQSERVAILREPCEDTMPGGEQTPTPDIPSLFVLTAPLDAVREPAEGETIRLPDIVVAPSEPIEEADTITSSLTYNPSITQSGAAPAGFGVTRPYTFTVSGISVTLSLIHI